MKGQQWMQSERLSIRLGAERCWAFVFVSLLKCGFLGAGASQFPVVGRTAYGINSGNAAIQPVSNYCFTQENTKRSSILNRRLVTRA